MEKKYYWIYMLECENGHYYTGYTDNIAKRFHEHLNSSKGAKYTRSFKPVRIAQCWRLLDTKGSAMKIEHIIKRMKRKSKESIVQNPLQLLDIIKNRLDSNIKIIVYNSELIKEQEI